MKVTYGGGNEHVKLRRFDFGILGFRSSWWVAWGSGDGNQHICKAGTLTLSCLSLDILYIHMRFLKELRRVLRTMDWATCYSSTFDSAR